MSFDDLLEKITELSSGPSDTPEAPPPELIAFCVRIARGMRQWKQSTLADFARVSLSTIERVERGEKVSAEALDRIGVALGYDRGYFTAPRCRKSAQESAAELADKYGHMEPISVRPLRTQAQVRAIARSSAFLIHRPDIGPAYDSDVAELAEWLDLASFIMSDIGGSPEEKGRRRELYNDILACAQRLERRGVNVLCGIMDAPQEGLPDWKVAILSLTPKLSDPAASKRKVVFVDRRCVQLPPLRTGNVEDASSGPRH